MYLQEWHEISMCHGRDRICRRRSRRRWRSTSSTSMALLGRLGEALVQSSGGRIILVRSEERQRLCAQCEADRSSLWENIGSQSAVRTLLEVTRNEFRHGHVTRHGMGMWHDMAQTDGLILFADLNPSIPVGINKTTSGTFPLIQIFSNPFQWLMICNFWIWKCKLSRKLTTDLLLDIIELLARILFFFLRFVCSKYHISQSILQTFTIRKMDTWNIMQFRR